MWSVWLKVLLWTDSPISAVELCSSFGVIFGLFVASLINALLAWSVSFGGRPSLGRFFPFYNHGFYSAPWDVQSLIFFYNPTLICTFPQLYPSPVWRAPWSSWCPLLSGVADTLAFQNRCIQFKSEVHIHLSQIHLNSVFHNSWHLRSVRITTLFKNVKCQNNSRENDFFQLLFLSSHFQWVRSLHTLD